TPTTSYLEAHAKGRACPKCAPVLKYGASLRSLVRRPCDFNYIQELLISARAWRTALNLSFAPKSTWNGPRRATLDEPRPISRRTVPEHPAMSAFAPVFWGITEIECASGHPTGFDFDRLPHWSL